MAKRIALKDAHQCGRRRPVATSAAASSSAREHERVDVSGFNATGASEFLAGQTEQSVTCRVLRQLRGRRGSRHPVPDPQRPRGRGVRVEARPAAAVSATNPELRGNVQILSYSPGGTRGEADTFEVTLTAADEDGLQFFNAAAA